jgi:hydroxyethylthiazole kinase
MLEIKPSIYHARVREAAPLVHNITNYVTVNDVANILLAAGASPIMADDPIDAEEITAICGGLVLNIGTLNQATIPAMLAAGKRANALGHPIVLDPVGAGASTLRTQTALRLLDELNIAVIRGNVSELKALAHGTGDTHGVDASLADAITEQTLPELASFARDYARATGAVIAITGAIDLVASDTRAYAIRNGHAWMTRITGSGCMLSALVGAFVVANPEFVLEASAAAVANMGVAGQLAWERVAGSGVGAGAGAGVGSGVGIGVGAMAGAGAGVGTASLRNELINIVSLLDGAVLDEHASIEEI